MSNPIKHFLGIDTDPKAPDLYLIFKIEEHANAEQVAKAADAAISKVRAQRPGELKREWAALIDFLTKAKNQLIAERRVQDPATVFDPPNIAAVEKSAPQPIPSTKNVARKPIEPPKATSKKASRTVATPPSSSNTPPKLTPKPVERSSPTAGASVPVILPKKNAPIRKPEKITAPTTKNNSDAPSHEDDFSFTLDAPDEKDSFDSDTHLSGNSLQPAAVIATTIDPMAPIADPTIEWDSFDLNQIVKPTNTPLVNDQQAKETAQPSATISEKTFFADSYRTKSRNGIMIGGTLIAMLVVGAISYLIIFGLPNGNSADPDNVVANNEKNDDGTNTATKAPSDTGPREDKSETPNDPTSIENGKSNERQPENDPSDADPSKINPDSMKSESGEKPDPDINPMTNPPVKPGDTTPDPPNPESKTPDSMTPDSGEAETKAPQPKNSEIAELASLLLAVREKLSQRDIVEANRILEKASSLPMVPEHKQKFERLKSVTELYGKFWNMVVEGCGKLKGLDEIKFSDTNIINVVESSEDRIVYRAIGKRFEKAPRELQIGIAMKIAEKELDNETPESRLIRGTVYAIEAFNDSDRAERAKEIWEEAVLLGANTDELVLFLDDEYDLLAGFIKKEKIPETDDSKAAQARFKSTYAAELKTASRNAETSMAFATKLLADAPKLDDAADRHANFVAAVFYASKTGNAEFLVKSLSDMNKWFSIDLDQKTFDALEAMNKMRLKPDQKREVARTAFEYMDRAKRAKNKELELKLANLALSAAKGTRDQKFIATATAELNRVKSSQ